MANRSIHYLNYLNFAADLRRVAFCLLNQNFAQAKVFADHAEKIYRSGLKLDSFAIVWQLLYQRMGNMTGRRDFVKAADKFLTLSSMIILRKS